MRRLAPKRRREAAAAAAAAALAAAAAAARSTCMYLKMNLLKVVELSSCNINDDDEERTTGICLCHTMWALGTWHEPSRTGICTGR